MIISWKEIVDTEWLRDIFRHDRLADPDDSVFKDEILEWIDETGVDITVSVDVVKNQTIEFCEENVEHVALSCRDLTFFIWNQSVCGTIKILMSDEEFMLMKLTFS